MLSWKYLPSSLSVDHLRRAASSGGVLSRPLACVQGYFQRHQVCNFKKMTGDNDGKKTTGQSKRRMQTAPVWMPKSVAASSSEGGHPDAAELLVEVHNDEVPSNSFTHLDAKKNSSDCAGFPKGDRQSICIEAGSLIRFVKGKHGFTQRQIEEETGVNIKFPSSKKETHIVVESTSMDNLLKASEKITKILEEAEKSPSLDYSHFVSLPLATHGDLVEKLTMFQSSILGEADLASDDDPCSSSDEDCLDVEQNIQSQDNATNIAANLKVVEEGHHVNVEPGRKSAKQTLSDMGIDKSIFINPRTFHLTVLMLKLYNKERFSLASEVLQNVSSKVNDALDNRPIFIKLKGLACMRGSPGKARVVYAPVEEKGGEGRLSRACKVIIDSYLEAGLILKEDAKQTLKLHATLMNVRHRKRKRKMVKKFDSFDARGIFEKHGSEDWGEYLIHEAHLSQRFKFDQDGYYYCCTSIPFPK